MRVLKSLAVKTLGRERVWELRKALNRVAYAGTARHCPCCSCGCRKFLSFGLVPRPNAQCPICGSLERHRLISLYLKQKTDLFDGRSKKLLHVAPETQLSILFDGESYIDYLSADLEPRKAMTGMDITDIQYPDGTFDVILCSHVLEHIPDDRGAMSEFFRVLRPGGWAILQVPIAADATFEDPSVTDPEVRQHLFGQHDHVRNYGPDYRDRLAEAGFSVTVDGFVRELDEVETRRFGLMRHEDVYFCRKAPFDV